MRKALIAHLGKEGFSRGRPVTSCFVKMSDSETQRKNRRVGLLRRWKEVSPTLKKENHWQNYKHWPPNYACLWSILWTVGILGTRNTTTLLTPNSLRRTLRRKKNRTQVTLTNMEFTKTEREPVQAWRILFLPMCQRDVDINNKCSGVGVFPLIDVAKLQNEAFICD